MVRSALFVDPVPGAPPVGTAAQDARIALASVIGTSFLRAGGGAVTRSGSSLQITVAAAVFILPDVTSALGAFLGAIDQQVFTATAGPATGSRIDSVFVKPDNYANGDADSRMTYTYVTGTPSATPSAPTAPSAAHQRYLDILVPTNASLATSCTVTIYAPVQLAAPDLIGSTLANLNLLTGTLGQQATVTQDPSAVNNGLYVWNGTKWLQWTALTGWTNFGSPYPSGFASPGGGVYPPAYKIVGDELRLAGAFQKTGGAVFAGGDALWTSPVAPASQVYFLANGQGGSFAGLQMSTAGALSVQSTKGTSGTWLSLDGTSIRLV